MKDYVLNIYIFLLLFTCNTDLVRSFFFFSWCVFPHLITAKCLFLGLNADASGTGNSNMLPNLGIFHFKLEIKRELVLQTDVP